jgi:hypothetical protein
MTIRPVRAKLFRADRQTDMANLIVTFRSYVKARKNWLYCPNACVTKRMIHSMSCISALFLVIVAAFENRNKQSVIFIRTNCTDIY